MQGFINDIRKKIQTLYLLIVIDRSTKIWDWNLKLEMFQASPIIICRNVKACHYCLYPRQRSEPGQKSSHRRSGRPINSKQGKARRYSRLESAIWHYSVFAHILNVTTQLGLCSSRCNSLYNGNSVDKSVLKHHDDEAPASLKSGAEVRIRTPTGGHQPTSANIEVKRIINEIRSCSCTASIAQ